MDDRGFVKTGSDLGGEPSVMPRWSRPRAPHLLETSIPGVFAAGDARAGSVKRIASAVGEGSIAVQFIHQTLREFADECGAAAAITPQQAKPSGWFSAAARAPLGGEKAIVVNSP